MLNRDTISASLLLPSLYPYTRFLIWAELYFWKSWGGLPWKCHNGKGKFCSMDSSSARLPTALTFLIIKRKEFKALCQKQQGLYMSIEEWSSTLRRVLFQDCDRVGLRNLNWIPCFVLTSNLSVLVYQAQPKMWHSHTILIYQFYWLLTLESWINYLDVLTRKIIGYNQKPMGLAAKIGQNR